MLVLGLATTTNQSVHLTGSTVTHWFNIDSSPLGAKLPDVIRRPDQRDQELFPKAKGAPWQCGLTDERLVCQECAEGGTVVYAATLALVGVRVKR